MFIWSYKLAIVLFFKRSQELSGCCSDFAQHGVLMLNEPKHLTELNTWGVWLGVKVIQIFERLCILYEIRLTAKAEQSW